MSAFPLLSASPQLLNVRRTRTSTELDISPFVLDPTSVTLVRARSSGQYRATYLQTPANATPVASHGEALSICEYLDRLRHPHLEQFIGVVTDASVRNHLIVTAQHGGRSVAQYVASASKAGPGKARLGADRLTLTDAFQIASHAALGLLYLHQNTRTGHHALCAHSLVHCRERGKTVVLLTNECKECHLSKGPPSRRADVLTLAKLIIALIKAVVHANPVHACNSIVSNVLTKLKHIVKTGNKPAFTMAHLCQLFLDGLNQI